LNDTVLRVQATASRASTPTTCQRERSNDMKMNTKLSGSPTQMYPVLVPKGQQVNERVRECVIYE
jgi:hypothetical protein